MLRISSLVALGVLVFVLTGCDLPAGSMDDDATKESRIGETAKKLGIRVEAIDFEASAQSPNGLIYIRPLIRTDKVDRLRKTTWSHLFGPTSQKGSFGEPAPDQDICWGQEYDPRFHDYCQCLFNPFNCPSVDDTLPCGPDDQCDDGDAPPPTSDDPADDGTTDDPTDPVVKYDIDVKLHAEREVYDNSTAWVDVRAYTRSIGEYVELMEAYEQVDVRLEIEIKEYRPTVNGEYSINTIKAGGWYRDQLDASYHAQFTRTGSQDPIYIAFSSTHEGEHFEETNADATRIKAKTRYIRTEELL